MTKQLGMLIDLRACAGCHACSVSCKSEHDVPLGSFRTRVETQEQGTYPQVKKQFVPLMCNQCTDAPCITSCPTGSLSKDENGVVVVNEDTCTSVGACVSACPYDAIYLHPDTGKAEKCDFCSDRMADGGLPACVSTCPTNALEIGDVSDPDSDISQHIREHGAEPIYKSDDELVPHVYYIQPDEVFREGLARLSGINDLAQKHKTTRLASSIPRGRGEGRP
ncbi:4Fe-4S dicluster domain-containing protein [Caldalkalibacillus salinus]|uniref:4Fe-4S dicluster domain-containing protein n=1 Tax=Caldalkalibacillus salinus TaxID=2803787 RepID=UPI0019218E96|nr:4Fe-4S dicluster domain-containing protein [Caldalkalibacillus salinus]